MTARLRVRFYDGARRKLVTTDKVLLTIRPQFKPNKVVAQWIDGDTFTREVAAPNDGTGYVVVAALRGHEQVGISPVKLEDNKTTTLHLMLVRRSAGYQFAGAAWENLAKKSALRRMLMGLESSEDAVKARYLQLLDSRPDNSACLLNVAAALEHLPVKNSKHRFNNAFDYLQAVDWQSTRKDRFFGYAHECLLTDLENASDLVDREKAPGVFHPGAFVSFKQKRFDEANLQVTFHHERLYSDVGPLIRVELDMDYFKDDVSHALLEVIPNTLSFGKRKTDPRRVYAMRWMAAKHAKENFEPLYTLA